jgi:hypothetical protein
MSGNAHFGIGSQEWQNHIYNVNIYIHYIKIYGQMGITGPGGGIFLRKSPGYFGVTNRRDFPVHNC